MDLLILTNPTTNKPGLDLYCYSLTAKTVTAQTSFVVPSLLVSGSAEVKGDLLVDGYSQSSQINPGTVLISSGTQTVAQPAGTGGESLTFNPTLNKLIMSSLAGPNTAASTVNGATWAQLTTPFANPGICYSPDLNLYAGIDGLGTAVYTSPTAVNGTWVIGTPAPSNFNSNRILWNSFFGRFYTEAAAPTQKVFSSVNGSIWTLQNSTRGQLGYAFSPLLNRLVSVGADGPQYTDDGKTWINSASTALMSDVTWSDYWKCFVASPRGPVLTAVYRSIDGITWTSNVGFPGFAGNLRAIIWIQDLMVFVAAGDNDVQFVSQDGFSWKQCQVTASALAVYGNTYVSKWGMYVAVGINLFARVSPKLFV